MTKKPFSLTEAYTLLEPGPVTLITTAHKGVQNIMTQSWHTMMEFVPPLVGCVISGNNHSFNLKTVVEQVKWCIYFSVRQGARAEL